jgi:hypothetical protein
MKASQNVPRLLSIEDWGIGIEIVDVGDGRWESGNWGFEMNAGTGEMGN